MNAPLVSVVIPAYNAARTLKATVQSVFEQTVQDFEIIVVDDGSTDDTIAVAQSIEDSRVKVITQLNGGAAAARNTGIKSAKGEYVAMLDADDLWMPHKLERQLAVFDSDKNVSAIQSGVYYVNDNLEVISVERCVESKDILYETLVFQNLPGLMSTLIVKRAVFEEIGYLDTKLVILEDWELAIRLARYCNFASIEEPLTLYRQFPGNRSKNVSIHIEPGYIILDRLFKDPSLPSHIKSREKQIYAAFYTMLCGGAFRCGRYGESLKWGAEAFITDPAALGYMASLHLRRLQRRSSRRSVPHEYKLALKNFLTLHTLYLCYFWLNEPLVQTQVLPYLRQLQKDGIKVSLMTFEREMSKNWTSEQIEEQKRKLAAEGIDWYCLPYHKSPSVLATLYDVFNGARLTRRIIREKRVDVLHSRSQVPACVAAIARQFSRREPKMIFDIRGFFPEEYIDAGIWKENGWLYRIVKRNEEWLLKKTDGFIVLTEKARQILFPESAKTGFDKSGRPVEVIPCCVDSKRFVTANKTSRAAIRKKYKLENRQVITYIGSLGGWYLADEMADLLKVAREKDDSTFALILTQSSPEIMAKKLKERGFADEDFLVTKVPHGEIPKYLSASDIALSFIKPCFSKLSSSPTKIAEYLASGIPIITNRGVGDVSEIIEKHQTGAVVQDFSREGYIESLRKIEELRRTDDLYEKCIKSAKEEFDLEEVGGAKYRLIYKRLSRRSSAAAHTLYLCYFGLREPLVQTQVLPYLREIKKIANMKVSLLTFEPDFKKKWTAEQIAAEKKKLAEENITWHCLPYHKRPSAPATVYDIFCGAGFVWRLMRREKIDVFHARAHIPAIFGLMARSFSRHKPKMLFDIRGFVPEEYTDAGIWKENGLIYRVFKRFEKWILRESDGFVILTENARDILFPESAETGFDKLGRPVEVIPCCVDFEKRFQGDQDELREKTRDELKLNDRLVITHLGTLGGLYLTEDIADFLQAAKNKYPNTFASFLTQTSPGLITTLLKERGFTEEDFFVGKISPTEVQRYLSASDIALSFVKATYATASRSPTKIPEYLACGLPIVSNRGVGDVDELFIEENVGILLDDFSSESYADALKQVLALRNDANFINKSQICAKDRFDLEKVGGERYRRIYNHLLNGKLDALRSAGDSLEIAGKVMHRRRLN